MATLPALRFAPLLLVVLLLPATPAAAPGPSKEAAQLQLAQCLSLQSRLDRQSLALADLQARARISAAQHELEQLRHAHQIEQLQSEKRQLAYLAAIAVLALLLGLSTGFGLLLRKRQKQLRRLSEVDALTGLANRRAATAALDALAAQPGPAGTRHVLFLIDVDHFKQINDGYGHHVGDDVLVTLAQRLKSACRPTDLVARWGGEEFLVACANLTREQAEQIAARLRRAMAYTFETAHSKRMVTVSLGLAPIPLHANGSGSPSRRWDYALRMADRALYAAKRHRDAWVGYWSADLPDEATAEAVLEQPDAATGLVSVLSSVPRLVKSAPEMARARSLRALRAQAG
ncbi:GGDEF domain-containing protein [Thermomonas alba]|uniref:GGDEF domain-containing protein n=1 Tax=Thermomonas alba TaxID=2888525 RepID=UPI001F03F482|nr:GGDEF domain-containing protein [Thermomonas alba]